MAFFYVLAKEVLSSAVFLPNFVFGFCFCVCVCVCVFFVQFICQLSAADVFLQFVMFFNFPLAFLAAEKGEANFAFAFCSRASFVLRQRFSTATRSFSRPNFDPCWECFFCLPTSSVSLC